MDYKTQEIQQILDKYWEGTTSLAEEQILRDYFTNGKVAPSLKSLKPMFQLFADDPVPVPDDSLFEQQLLAAIEAESDIKPKAKIVSLRTRSFAWRIAAGLAILVGALFIGNSYYQYQKEQMAYQDTFEDPEEAYAAFESALLLVSAKMNQGQAKASEQIRQVRMKTKR